MQLRHMRNDRKAVLMTKNFIDAKIRKKSIKAKLLMWYFFK
jgi:hypothetical protein